MGECCLCKAEVASSTLASSIFFRDIAQSGSASALGAEGRWFESSYPDTIHWRVTQW